ncbi:MAG: hypothetical protein Q8O31_09230 [Rhodocyclaceae bacterium]|nr:hypothetical protein [Rhodocyclaceae bacterium]
MMHPDLSFDQAPPVSVPYRFFLTAPWFGVAAGLLLVIQGGDALVSRWTPQALMLTHLLTVGFMLQAMVGALFQFIPVAAGGNVWQANRLASLVHPVLAVAAVLLVLAFPSSTPALFHAAAGLFAIALGSYGLIVGIALWRTPAQGATILTLRVALFGLMVTATLGVVLAIGLGLQKSLDLFEWTNVHAAWGLGGWALMLIAGVSYFVVPMFQLTPKYPAWLTRTLPWAMLAVLCLWSSQLIGDGFVWLRGRIWLMGLLVATTWGVVTLRLQFRRRRKVPDITLTFFRGGMLSLVALFISALLFEVNPNWGTHPRADVWLGVLILQGVFVSVINGMLYKIMPFLNWLHLQRLCGLTVVPPNMKKMIPDVSMFWQMRLHFSALALMLCSVVWPILTRPAGALFALSCAWMGVNLLIGVKSYRQFKVQILASGAGSES